MHTNLDAQAYIESTLAHHGEDPRAYFIAAIADEFHDTHSTWDLVRIDPSDFWPVVTAYYAGDDDYICEFE